MQPMSPASNSSSTAANLNSDRKTDMTTYDGKRVVITGGTSGIGLATAQLLSAGGARVMVTGRTLASLDAARTTLGPTAVVVANDAVSEIDALVDRAAAE